MGTTSVLRARTVGPGLSEVRTRCGPAAPRSSQITVLVAENLRLKNLAVALKRDIAELREILEER